MRFPALRGRYWWRSVRATRPFLANNEAARPGGAEETLLTEGRGDAVIQQRVHFQDIMRERYSAVVTQETGRPVTAFMSGTHQGPDMQSEVFVLEQEEASSGPDGLSDMHAG